MDTLECCQSETSGPASMVGERDADSLLLLRLVNLGSQLLMAPLISVALRGESKCIAYCCLIILDNEKKCLCGSQSVA